MNELNGDIYVYDSRQYTNAVVNVLEPNGLGGYALVRQIEGPAGRAFHAPYTMTVDSRNGEVYVTEFAPEGYYIPREQEYENGKYMIDEFSAIGAYIGHVEHIPDAYAIAVNPETHDLYARQQGYGPDLVLPDVTTEPVSAETPRSVTLNGTVNPGGGGEATCQFDWGPTPSLGKVAPCSEPIPDGDEAVPVHAVLSEFERNTSYYYRLQAGNENGTNLGLPVQDRQFTTRGAVVGLASATDVSADAATLRASIDPGSTPTSYYFQYGLSSAYEHDAPAPPGPSIGSGGEFLEVPALGLTGLSGSTVYHYRVVATSEPQPGEIETLYSPDRTFTTQAAKGSFSLPDGRQWELVSPSNKRGALIASNRADGESVVQAAADGGALAYHTSTPTEQDPAGYAFSVTVLSTHGAAGWSSLDISEPNLAAVHQRSSKGNEFQIFSEDLSRAAVQPVESVFTPLSPEASEETAYLRSDFLGGNVNEACRSGCYRALVTGKAGFANVPPGTAFGEEPSGSCATERCGPKFQGASRDLEHIVLSSSAQLTATPAPADGEGMYEWSNGSLQLLDQLPKGEEGPALLAGSGIGTIRGESGISMGVRNSVSDNGQRVVLEGGARGGQGVYLRETATAANPSGETIRLDVPQGVSGTSEDPRYMDASSDGSRIFFIDSGRLTADASPSGEDLYEYDLYAPVGQRLRDLSVPTGTGASANVTMLIGASEDGSYVYFAAGGVLAPGAVEGECPFFSSQARPGCNIYVSHEGAVRLVAVVPSADGYDWSPSLAQTSPGLFARVAPDGRWLAFESDGELTGYDPRDALSGRPDAEVYVYGADAGELACASCDPTGARPIGRLREKEEGLDNHWAAARVSWWTAVPKGYGSRAVHQPRYLSDSGRVVFDSMGPLVPQDVNGVEDVYEWEPAGVGGCSSTSATFSARSGGCADLVSSGASPEPSEFIDASESGGDVFFRTLARLVPQDYDVAFDIYDAHECTSAAPCSAASPQPPACDTEASCKAPPLPQPALYGSPASATFSGTGNQPSQSAPAVSGKAKAKRKSKGKAKRKGKSKGGRREPLRCRGRAARRGCARAGRQGRDGGARVGRVERGGGR